MMETKHMTPVPREALPRFLLLPRQVTMMLALLLVGLIGFVDYVTDKDLTFSAYYLMPVALAGWAAGRKAGLVFAIGSSVVWLVVECFTGQVHQDPAVPYWNAVTLLLVLLMVAYVLSGIRWMNRHLEDAVQQRTAALRAEMAERRRAERAKLQAERLAVAGTMAAEVAHEVRNPLGSIKLNMDLINREIERLAESSTHAPTEGRTLVNEVREEVCRIQRVIGEFLTLARLPKPELQPVRLTDFLQQKLGFMSSDFAQAGIRLRTDFDRGLNQIDADPDQLWQAILNLVRNAMEAMPGGGTLTVTTTELSDRARISVSDTGKGMSEEEQRQVFVPFYSTKPSGTGLGLALTQQILHEHGAHIECASTPGKGSTFTIHFPVPAPAV
jgi:signal transduction histidine kinase